MTVAIVPRERLTTTVATVGMVLATIPADVPVVIVDGAYPRDVRREIDKLLVKRPATLLRFDRYLLPAEARNLALDTVTTPYVAFVDNDLIVKDGWLAPLVAAALEEKDAVFVAPLTLIHVDRGGGARDYVHYAAGRINYVPYKGRLTFGAERRLEWADPDDPRLDELPKFSETLEFHGFLADAARLRRLGGLDKRLVICDHDDLSLRVHEQGLKIIFCRTAVVAYDQTGEATAADRAYMAFRWSRRRVEQSCRIFEENWGIAQTYSSEFGVKHRRIIFSLKAKGIGKLVPPGWFERYVALLDVLTTFRAGRWRRLFAGRARTCPPPSPEYRNFLLAELVKYQRRRFPRMEAHKGLPGGKEHGAHLPA